MEVDFLHRFFDQLFQAEFKSLGQAEPMFAYIDTLVVVCRKIQQVCNNSAICVAAFSDYLRNKLLALDSPPQEQQLQLLHRLRGEQKHVRYLTQIGFRVVLLSYLCKQGEDKVRRDWREGLAMLVDEARMEFMFNCNESLATLLVSLVNRIREVCHELVFYQKLVGFFEKKDLEYFVEDLRKKIAGVKQNWKEKRSQASLNLTPKQQKPVENAEITDLCSANPDKAQTEKRKNSRKSVNVSSFGPKVEQEEVVRQRISNFRDREKKRKSQLFQSSGKRTIFHERKYIKKQQSAEEEEDGSELQLLEMEDYLEAVDLPKQTQNKSEQPCLLIQNQKTNPSKVSRSKSKTKPACQEPETDGDCFLAPSTPPREQTQGWQHRK